MHFIEKHKSIIINREEIIWAAGLFEGEGCIHLSKQQGGKYLLPKLSLGMTDRDVVERFHKAVGNMGSIVFRSKRKEHWKDTWIWQGYGFEVSQAIIAMFWPWLGERRKTKAEEVLKNKVCKPANWNFQSEKTHCPKGHEYNEENTYWYDGKRSCRICGNEKQKRYQQKIKNRGTVYG